VLYDQVDLLLIVLDVVVSQVYYSKFILGLEMRSLDKVENLHPVALLQTVLSEVLHKLDYQVGFLHLLVHNLANGPTLSLDELMLG